MLYLGLDDPLVPWDLGRSFLWLGAAVLGLLRELRLNATMVESRQPRTALGSLICFADLGYGEVSVDGAKVLGLAQRRSRGQACFQLSLLWEERQSHLRELLVVDPPEGESLRVAGIAPLVDLSRQDVQNRVVKAITAL
jgi:lipoate-protein ligase A